MQRPIPYFDPESQDIDHQRRRFLGLAAAVATSGLVLPGKARAQADKAEPVRIAKAILAGYDWGARTANIIAALWPERCKAIVSVNSYLINNLERNKLPLSPKAEWGWWYQYYFATDRGRAGFAANRREPG